MGKRYANYKSNTYVEKGRDGRFKTVVRMGRSLARDRTTKSAHKVKSGYGGQGDIKAKMRARRMRRERMNPFSIVVHDAHERAKRRFSRNSKITVI